MTGPDPWPYLDLKLCTPHCPMCGGRAEMLVGSNVHPMAWCTDETCDVMTWDPSVPAAELVADPKVLRSHTDEHGHTVHRPE